MKRWLDPSKIGMMTCRCKWTYLRINSEYWWGPFWHDSIGANFGRLLTRETMQTEYGDCWNYLEKKGKLL